MTGEIFPDGTTLIMISNLLTSGQFHVYGMETPDGTLLMVDIDSGAAADSLNLPVKLPEGVKLEIVKLAQAFPTVSGIQLPDSAGVALITVIGKGVTLSYSSGRIVDGKLVKAEPIAA